MSVTTTNTTEPPRVGDAALDRFTADMSLALIRVDGAWMTARDLLAELDRLRAEVAELKAKADPLAEMWRELSEYQPIADREGHGKSWARMCERRTQSAAWAAASCAKRYSLSARNAAEFVAIGLGESRAQQAIKAIRKAQEVQP